MKWFSEKRLFKEATSAENEECEDQDEDDWMVTDLRKIVLYMTLSVLDKKLASSQASRDFLKKCVNKFSAAKVKEFMEIQLMHHNELSLQLLDWLDSSFESRIKQTESSMPNVVRPESGDSGYNRVKLPKVNLEEMKTRNNQQDNVSITVES